MRKLIAAVAATVALAAVTGTTAGAQTVSKFSVQTVNSHPLHGARTNIIVGRLAEPGEAEFVGRFAAKFGRRQHVKAIASFNGRGRIKFAGSFRNNNRLQILGGSGVWNGASGKVKVHNIAHGEVILTFTVVQ
jgi:hypothetical protein